MAGEKKGLSSSLLIIRMAASIVNIQNTTPIASSKNCFDTLSISMITVVRHSMSFCIVTCSLQSGPFQLSPPAALTRQVWVGGW